MINSEMCFLPRAGSTFRNHNLALNPQGWQPGRQNGKPRVRQPNEVHRETELWEGKREGKPCLRSLESKRVLDRMDTR